jgi:hypothetical protein
MTAPGHEIKPIGADLIRAPVPPRSVVFWGSKNQLARDVKRQEAVLGVDEGKVRSLASRAKREKWIPSRDPAAEQGLFHWGKSTYVRGSHALTKQQIINDREGVKGHMPRPASAQSERPRTGIRSASPLIVRPSSACTNRSKRSTSEKSQAWWTKNSWDIGLEGLQKLDTFKKRILDDIMQDAAFVRVDDSDAYKFGAGRDDLKFIEVPVAKTQPSETSKVKKKKLKSKNKQKAKPRPSTSLGTNMAPQGPTADSLQSIARMARSEAEKFSYTNQGYRRAQRPSDLTPHPSRSQHVVASHTRAIMDRSSSTLRHIQALRKRNLTADEIKNMIAPFSKDLLSDNNFTESISGSGADFTNRSPSHARQATLSPEVASPCSLDSKILIAEDDEIDEDSHDTFEFTEGEEETLDWSAASAGAELGEAVGTESVAANGSGIPVGEQNLSESTLVKMAGNKAASPDPDNVRRCSLNDSRFQGQDQSELDALSFDDFSDEWKDGRGGEINNVAPKDAFSFMPKKVLRSSYHEREIEGMDGMSLRTWDPHQDPRAPSGMNAQGGSTGGAYRMHHRASDSGQEGLDFAMSFVDGAGHYEDVNAASDRSASSSSIDSMRRRGAEEDSGGGWGPPSGATDPPLQVRAAHRYTPPEHTLKKPTPQSVSSKGASGSKKKSASGVMCGDGPFPAAAAHLFNTVNEQRERINRL